MSEGTDYKKLSKDEKTDISKDNNVPRKLENTKKQNGKSYTGKTKNIKQHK